MDGVIREEHVFVEDVTVALDGTRLVRNGESFSVSYEVTTAFGPDDLVRYSAGDRVASTSSYPKRAFIWAEAPPAEWASTRWPEPDDREDDDGGDQADDDPCTPHRVPRLYLNDWVSEGDEARTSPRHER